MTTGEFKDAALHHPAHMSINTKLYLNYLTYKRNAYMMGTEPVSYDYWLHMDDRIRYRYIMVYSNIEYHSDADAVEAKRRAEIGVV